MARLVRKHHLLLERFVSALADAAASSSRLLMAVSGGADSMALLELTALARPTPVARDAVAYVDHGLRPESSTEAAQVEAAAGRHGLAFHLLRPVIVGSDEAALRTARYAALEGLAQREGCAHLLTGHTLDDQVETILHRLVRGAGRKGLSGMPSRRGMVLRPLLGFRRRELREFLRERAVAWCEDQSNCDSRYLRNRIRHRIVPTFEQEMGPDCLTRLPAMAEVWRDEDAFLDAEAARYAEYAVRGNAGQRCLDVAALRGSPAALHLRMIRGWLAEATGRSPESFALPELKAVLGLALSSERKRSLELAGATLQACDGRLSVERGRFAAHGVA